MELGVSKIRPINTALWLESDESTEKLSVLVQLESEGL